jgi:hypothetical protein
MNYCCFTTPIKNPNTSYLEEWYLERRFRIENKRYYSAIQMFYWKDEQMEKEETLKANAISDLHTYVLGANRKREFIIHFLEIEDDGNFFICKHAKNTWWLIKYEDYRPFRKEKKENDSKVKQQCWKVPLSKQFLMNAAFNVHVVGIKFIDVIHHKGCEESRKIVTTL